MLFATFTQVNIQQIQYVLTVAEIRHFEQAADKCFVTQSTLSTMIGKLEDELGMKIFDRKTKPVSITKAGEAIIGQLQIISKEIRTLEYKVQELKGEIAGELRIGVIPTVAPSLLPLFLTQFALRFPKVHIWVQEMTTTQIQKSLKNRSLDIGIAAIPLEDKALQEQALYNESFLLFDCHSKVENFSKKIKIEDIDLSQLLLLEEGHCLRTQVQQICKLSKTNAGKRMNFEFRAGSIDSLIRFTKAHQGITLIPHLASLDLSAEDSMRIRAFASPVPIRSVGLVVHRHFVKKRLLDELQQAIQEGVSTLLSNDEKQQLYKPLR
jgi:LysR family hydrogen peroxide-inducible transcriptional activator